VVPEKRKLMVVSGLIAAAFALPGCAPTGYNAADYGAGAAPEAQPAANAVEASPNAEGNDAEKDSDVSEDKLTTELVGQSVPRMGKVVKDQEGWILYRFDEDTDDPSASNCDGRCAELWPPALSKDGKPKLDGVASDQVGLVEREDGTKQLTIGGWPVYRYAKDEKKKTGESTWRGQGIGRTWYVVQPDGERNLSCLPKGATKPGPSDKKDDDNDDYESGSGDSGSDYSY
jgi:predicted lipoprotein with Yx(FWY)xxD motif